MNFDWTSIQNLFPVNNELIWLNNAGTTPASQPAVDSVNQFLQGYSKRGVYTTVETYLETKKFLRETLAELLNCSPQEISIIHNTSEGMNFISYGLNLKPKDEILLLENEYPSNVYPWEHWLEKGVLLKFIPLSKNLNEFLENLSRHVTERTRVVSLSAVHWCTGMPLPLKEIGQICKERNIYFVVDGAQGVGNIPIDVNDMQIDFMAFSGWKWLLGPLGIGTLYISQEKLQELKHIFKGTDSVINSEEYLPYKKDLKLGADRYEFSTANFNDWVYWKASLKLLKEIGWQKVMQRIYELNHLLASSLRTLGFHLSTDEFQESSGILTAWHEKKSSSEIVRYLKKQGIITANRLGRVRFSPHIYISEEQIQRVRETLEKFLKE